MLAMLGIGLTACQPDTDAGPNDEDDAPPVIEVTAVDYAYAVPDSIPSGWTTFQMTNKGKESHHFHLFRLPDGKTFEDYRDAYITPVDSIGQLLVAGKIDSAEAGKAFARAVPGWVSPSNRKPGGGVGLVAPGRTGEATVKLDPGTYVMDCTIRTSSGRPHWRHGMVRPLTVMEAKTGASPPEPNITVKSVGREIISAESLPSGRQTVGFRVEELPAEMDSAYSAWLVRLDADTDVEEVAGWNFQNPAPAQYLGGFEYIPASQHAYMTADLTPGRYAWIWFYLGMEDLFGEGEPMVKAFTVE